jgi:hypothetical protein
VVGASVDIRKLIEFYPVFVTNAVYTHSLLVSGRDRGAKNKRMITG